DVVDVLGELLAACLLVLAILRLVSKWQDDEIKHGIMSRRNIGVAYEADRLLQSEVSSDAVADQFLKRIQDLDSDDSSLLLNMSAADKQSAYREALKRFTPGDSTPCPTCGADPNKFTQGSCQVCGGTPVTRRTV
ncbi:MAG: mobilome CxxCx(11)CxxC protein, partial [Cyanobacteria bacterium P01_F01_bin.3]